MYLFENNYYKYVFRQTWIFLPAKYSIENAITTIYNDTKTDQNRRHGACVQADRNEQLHFAIDFTCNRVLRRLVKW